MALEFNIPQLQGALGCTLQRAEASFGGLIYMAEKFGITTPGRMAMFLAQVGHETMGLQYQAEIWGPTPQQKRYERDFSQAWSPTNERNKLAYKLGNTESGDGRRFAGHGWFQTTGRYNHKQLQSGLQKYLPGETIPNFEANPELLAQAPWASAAGLYYWATHDLNAFADSGNIVKCTEEINGGTNGLADRKARWDNAKKVLKA